MKYSMHVPTEQYGYIAAEDVEGTVEDAVALYKAIREEVAPKPISNIESKEWIELYNAVAGGVPYQGDPGILDSLNPAQKMCINEAKKWVKRMKV